MLKKSWAKFKASSGIHSVGADYYCTKIKIKSLFMTINNGYKYSTS